MNDTKKKAVVTGGAGFIGSHIVRELLSRGFETHIVDDLSGSKGEHIPEEAVFHKLDILNTEKLTKVMENAQAVFHLAALPRVPYSIEHPVESNRANIDGTLSVLVAAKAANVKKVVYAASSSAYGDQPTMPMVETMMANPTNPYGLQKYVGELYLRVFANVYGLKTVSLRFFNVYGPGMDPEGGYALAIPKFMVQAKKGEAITITGDGSVTRDFTNVRDVVAACMHAMESENVGSGEVLNIGTGRNISIAYLADLIDGGEAAGKKRVYIAPRAEAHDSQADHSLATKILGWEPKITIEEGIEELRKEASIS